MHVPEQVQPDVPLTRQPAHGPAAEVPAAVVPASSGARANFRSRTTKSSTAATPASAAPARFGFPLGAAKPASKPAKGKPAASKKKK